MVTTTLPYVLDLVDDQSLHVLWVTPDQAATQQLIRWVKEHHLLQLAAGPHRGDARVWVARGQERYRHSAGGILRVVPATSVQALRDLDPDSVVLPGGRDAYLPTAAREVLRPILAGGAGVLAW